MLNECNADVILLAGDIVDEDLAPVIHNDLGRSLLKSLIPHSIRLFCAPFQISQQVISLVRWEKFINLQMAELHSLLPL